MPTIGFSPSPSRRPSPDVGLPRVTGDPLADLDLILTAAGLDLADPRRGIAVLYAGLPDGVPPALAPFMVYVPGAATVPDNNPDDPAIVAKMIRTSPAIPPPPCPCCHAPLMHVFIRPPRDVQAARTAAACPACSRRMEIRPSWGPVADALRIALLGMLFVAQGRGNWISRQLAGFASRQEIKRTCRILGIPPDLFLNRFKSTR